MADLNVINANELPIVDEPETGQSIVMVDRSTNGGMVLDIDKLIETIISKLYTEEPSEDSMKVFVIE